MPSGPDDVRARLHARLSEAAPGEYPTDAPIEHPAPEERLRRGWDRVRAWFATLPEQIRKVRR